MISRTYVVKMPTSSSATPLDILVQDAPGTQDDPTIVADAAYYELRGRPLRFQTLAADGVSGGFVPRLRLGFACTVTPIKGAIDTDIPGVELSASLISLASTDGGPSINIPAFPDPSGLPAIRLTGGAGTAGGFYLVTLLPMEPKDDDRTGLGV